MTQDEIPEISEPAAPRPPRQRVPRPEVPAGERAIEAAILSHVIALGPDKSISPNEIAMSLGPDWRTKLTAVRRAAIHLAVAGQIDILRKGKKVDPTGAKGVIRLRVGSMRSEMSDPEAQG
jgi:hypothetical protein